MNLDFIIDSLDQFATFGDAAADILGGFADLFLTGEDDDGNVTPSLIQELSSAAGSSDDAETTTDGDAGSSLADLSSEDDE